MKKFLVLTATSIISMFICCVYANTSEIDTTMQTEDCKRVGNVELTTRQNGDKIHVVAENDNDYRVTVRYKIYATNGVNTYPIDSGILSVPPKNKNGNASGVAMGPWVKVPNGYSCYLEMEKPEFCS